MVTSTAYESAIQSLWCDTCTIMSLQNSVNATTGVTEQTPVALVTNEPCRMSHKTVVIAQESDSATRTAQETVLFIDKSITIPAGCTIAITHEGVTHNYKQSGVPAVYSYHQQVPITLIGEWV